MVESSINSHKSTNIKFLCSYGGKILPRYPDGELRYYGGETRVLSVHRSISFAELMVKLGEMCGGSVRALRCQLPGEDLDALVSITSDEDLANLIQEYDHTAIASPSSSLKIRSFLSPPKSAKKVMSPNSSVASSSSTTSANSPKSCCIKAASPRFSKCQSDRQTMAKPQMVFPLCYQKATGKLPQYAYHGPGSHYYLIHHVNH